MLYSILVAVDVLLAIGIIGLVLIQQGKGADVGAAFGSGASGTVFGARGSASFLTRATAVLVTLFFINSLVLAYLASHRPVAESVIDTTQEIVEEVPVIESTENMPDASSDLLKADESETMDVFPSSEETSTDTIEELSESTPDDVPE